MDLNTLDTSTLAESGVLVPLTSPRDGSALIDSKSGEPIGIRVLGADSRRYLEASRRLATKRLNKRLRGGKVTVSAEEVDADNLELAVTATVGWQHMVLDGQPLQFSEAACRKLYTRFSWMRDQVEEFINDRSNFLGESSTSS